MSKILVFPISLRQMAEEGSANYVKFQFLQQNPLGSQDDQLLECAPTIHMYIPQGFGIQDSANFGSVNTATLSAV